VVLNGLSCGVPNPAGFADDVDAVSMFELELEPAWAFKGFDINRIVVVGCAFFEGVEGAVRPYPILKRAFAGAGTPGLKACPGNGVLSSDIEISDALPRPILSRLFSSKVKWSVCGRDVASGKEEYGVDFCVSSSMTSSMGRGGNVVLLSFMLSLEDVVEAGVVDDLDVVLRLSPREVASALIDEPTVLEAAIARRNRARIGRQVKGSKEE